MGVDWYLMIGTSLAKTMMIAAMMPWALLCMGISMWKFAQYRDYWAASSRTEEESDVMANDDEKDG